MGRLIVRDLPAAATVEAAFGAVLRGRYPFFLDSALPDRASSRYSFLGCDPFLIFSSKGDRIRITPEGGAARTSRGDPFAALGALCRRYARPRPRRAGAFPFTGGGVGYFGYDMKRFVERLPAAAIDDLGVPDCVFAFYDTIIAYDHRDGRAALVGADSAKVGLMERRLRMPIPPARGGAFARRVTVRQTTSKAAYLGAVARAKRYIEKGDIYQVNLSQRFIADLPVSASELYRRLRAASPAPYAAYLGFGDVAVASSSPERFLMRRGSYLETRPIKGTRPRGATRRADERLRRELVASAKDRAEHIMIVDLERNDLGRICRHGSVAPRGSPAVERYANVFHLVSTVAGRLRPGVSTVDILRATFPGGSITGAPKIRSMEIIDELEPVARSVYTGAIGYIGFDGDMDLSIAIRTFVIHGKKAYFSVGGGIVADSDPQEEYEETLDKARGLFEALGLPAASGKGVRVR